MCLLGSNGLTPLLSVWSQPEMLPVCEEEEKHQIAVIFSRHIEKQLIMSEYHPCDI